MNRARHALARTIEPAFALDTNVTAIFFEIGWRGGRVCDIIEGGGKECRRIRHDTCCKKTIRCGQRSVAYLFGQRECVRELAGRGRIDLMGSARLRPLRDRYGHHGDRSHAHHRAIGNGAGDMHPPMPGVRQCTSAAREVLLGVRQPGLRAAAATVAVPTKVLIRSAAGVAAQGSAPPAGVFRVTVRR